MALNPAEESLYPFATRDSEAIPLDIIDPTGTIYYSVPATGFVNGTFPAGFDLGFVWSQTGCILDLAAAVAGPPVSGSYQTKTLFVPPGVMLTVKFNSSLGFYRIVSVGNAGVVVMQSVRKWNALALQQQIRVK